MNQFPYANRARRRAGRKPYTRRTSAGHRNRRRKTPRDTNKEIGRRHLPPPQRHLSTRKQGAWGPVKQAPAFRRHLRHYRNSPQLSPAASQRQSPTASGMIGRDTDLLSIAPRRHAPATPPWPAVAPARCSLPRHAFRAALPGPNFEKGDRRAGRGIVPADRLIHFRPGALCASLPVLIGSAQQTIPSASRLSAQRRPYLPSPPAKAYLSRRQSVLPSSRTHSSKKHGVQLAHFLRVSDPVRLPECRPAPRAWETRTPLSPGRPDPGRPSCSGCPALVTTDHHCHPHAAPPADPPGSPEDATS